MAGALSQRHRAAKTARAPRFQIKLFADMGRGDAADSLIASAPGITPSVMHRNEAPRSNLTDIVQSSASIRCRGRGRQDDISEELQQDMSYASIARSPS